MSNEYKELPIDSVSAEFLAAQNLRLELVDTSDEKRFEPWIHADMRGFHGGVPSDDEMKEHLRGFAYRRTTGVWDDSIADAATPVATVNSWPSPLTVPGERSVEAWAVSSVTVAPTHRRRGIARLLLEAELRTAKELGVPLAMLTVSESTIYGRFGFAPAVLASNWKVDTRRAKWTGPKPAGRVQLIPLAELRTQVGELVDRARVATPGEVGTWDMLWDRIFAGTSDMKDAAKKRRGLRFDDEHGHPQGFAIYSVKGGDQDFAAHTLDVHYLLTTTNDAYAALWRYLLEVDLVTEVNAHLRPVDEPLGWLVSDFRGVRAETTEDHLWLRILDVPAALGARSYSADGQLVFEVLDPLGYAHGKFLVDIAQGAASVSRVDGAIPDAASAVSLTVNELSALYLGGVSAQSLVRAGRIVELRKGSGGAVDRAFRSSTAPWLSVWF